VNTENPVRAVKRISVTVDNRETLILRVLIRQTIPLLLQPEAYPGHRRLDLVKTLLCALQEGGDLSDLLPANTPENPAGDNETLKIARYKRSRFWALYGPDQDLICLCVYKKGAESVRRYLRCRPAPEDPACRACRCALGMREP
jgi:hypothetical protein